MSGEHDPRVLVLQELRKQTALLQQILAALAPQADRVLDALLNGPHGDPIIKAKDPRDWAGEPMTGRTFSQCSPEYLDLLADRFDFFANDPEKADKRQYNERDAKRARGWAARLRSGWTRPATEPMTQPQEQGEPSW